MRSNIIKFATSTAILFSAGAVTNGFAQDAAAPVPMTIKATVNGDDVKSMDSILTALYDVVSGPKGTKRDWNRMKGLFIEGGKLQPTGRGGMRNWTVEDYAGIAGKSLEGVDFFETENSRIVETFGAITHVFSTYESRHSPSDAEPFMRGINSIQLFDDGTRWWIVSVFWQGEDKDNPLPSKYLK
jgi:hypothetical protein